jgi:hypothetical protein
VRRRFARFKLCAHLLDLRGLLFHRRSEGCDLFLQLRNRPSLFLYGAVLAAVPESTNQISVSAAIAWVSNIRYCFHVFIILLRDLPSQVCGNLPELEKIVSRVWGDNREAATNKDALSRCQ